MAELSSIPGLTRTLRTTRGRLMRLSVWRASWPFLVFLGGYVLLALSGLLGQADPFVAAVAAVLFYLGGGGLAWRAWRRYRPPGNAEAVAILDAQSDLRPIASLMDRPVRADPASGALWAAHQARLRAAADALRAPRLDAAWRRADPAWLRVLLPAMILGAALVADGRAGTRLHAALVPDLGALAGADDLRLEAWVSPPDYTRRPPVFLSRDDREVTVPEGSTVTVRAFARSAPDLALDGAGRRTRHTMSRTPDGAFEATAEVRESARLSVRWWGERAGWSLDVTEDAEPRVSFSEPPTRTETDGTRFGYEVSDDHGVDTLVLELRLQDPHPADPDARDRVAVPLADTVPETASETATLDLTRHRWAGLPVEGRLVATDAAGQEGKSAPVSFTLPEKLFLQPLAQAAQEVRVTVLREPRGYGDGVPAGGGLDAGAVNTDSSRRLAHAPDGVHKAALMLDALTYEAADYVEDWSVYAGMRMARGILETAPDKAEADTVDSLLWSVALKAEHGSSADALRALLAAREALEDALRDGASEDEVRRLAQAFQQAAKDYLAARMAEALAQGLPEPGPGESAQAQDGQSLGGQDFQSMLDALSDLAETGAADQARQLLSDITNMLQNLQFQQGGDGNGGFPGMPGQDGEEAEPSREEREMAEALEGLSELLRQQRELNDDTLAEQQGRQIAPDPGGESGAAPGGGSGALSERQRGLAGESGNLADPDAPEDGTGAGASGDEAGEARSGALDEAARERLRTIRRLQEEAASALARGDVRRARQLQEEATEALGELSRAFAEDLDRLEAARQRGQGQVDPFGRRVGGEEDGDVRIPDAAERQRAKDILDELRRRFDGAEDEDERNYLERLLDRF